jgi:hypothetical protein
MDATAAGALIELAPEMGATMTAPGLGPIRGRADPIVGERIRAVGRTSGLVEGSVIAVNESVPVRISPTESAGLAGMIRTSPISEQGGLGCTGRQRPRETHRLRVRRLAKFLDRDADTAGP